MKLMVIDGNSIVNRAFYGVRLLSTRDGIFTNAVFGFLNILHKLVNEEEPDSLCVTFDLKAPTFRHEQYEGYKAQRKGMPDELAMQMPILKEVMDAMNIPRYELAGYEADDLIGTISKKCAAAGWNCVIVTGDKDSFQLVSDKTYVKHVKSRMGQTETKIYDENAFFEEYGFTPEKMVDLKALMGDSSDNIPGVQGVGEKTAMSLIQNFGTVKNIYDNLDTIEIKESVRKKLDAGRESAKMSYELATICCDAPIDFIPEDNIRKPVNNDKLYALFKKLEFNKFIEKFSLTEPCETEESPEMFEGICESVEVNSDEDLARMKKAVSDGVIAVYFSGDFSICAAIADDVAFLIRDTSPMYGNAMKTLCSESVKKAGHNVKDIMCHLLSEGFETEGWVFDSALAAYLLEPTMNSYDLDSLAEQYCNFRIAHGDEENWQLSLLADEVQELARILSEGAAVLCLMERLLPKLEESGLDKIFNEIEMPLCRILADMEHQGVLADKKALHDFGEKLSVDIDRLQKEIYRLADEEFNINSPKQLGTVLFEKLMLPAPKKTKTGWSTNIDVLEKLKSKHPIINLIIDYRQLTKLKNTYTDGLQKVIDETDGRIHTKFQMTVTATGRLSSVEPNLQNIPVRSELGGEIRKMFIAGEGNTLVDADYSQIELRLLACISGDEEMEKAFLSGADFHTVTAANVFNVDVENVTPVLRSRAKAVNFGIVYGMSPFSLSQDIGVTVSEAKAYMDSYLEKYAGVRHYMTEIVEKAKKDGYVSTIYGRRRYLPELQSKNHNIRSFGERVALNMPIQGTAADIMKIAMINVWNALKNENLKAKLILQIHDELIVECPENEKDKVKEILKREMENAVKLPVPLTVEALSGKSWHEAK